MKYSNVEELPVWMSAHELTLAIYKVSSSFPKEEMYALTSQIRRSASSIPANISEGFYRRSTKELIQFIYNARGSLGETRYHIRLARDLNYINNDKYENIISQIEIVSKQLNGWLKSLQAKLKTP